MPNFKPGSGPKFIGGKVWPTIATILSTKKPKVAVVAYVGAGAKKLLRLTPHDVLITDFSDLSIKSGATNPYAILEIVESNVRVYNVSNLHAKVYITDDAVVVGSANASSNSANTVYEACVVISDARTVGTVKEWAHGLMGEALQREFVKEKCKLAPDRLPGQLTEGTASEPLQARLWLEYISPGSIPREFESRTEKRIDSLQAAMISPSYEPSVRVGPTLYANKAFDENVAAGDQVIFIELGKNGKPAKVMPPVRVLGVETGNDAKNREHLFLYFEQDLRLKRIPYLTFKTKAEAIGLQLKAELPTAREIRKPNVARLLRQIWATKTT